MCESGKREERSDELMGRHQQQDEERERAKQRREERKEKAASHIIFLRRPSASAHKLFFFSFFSKASYVTPPLSFDQSPTATSHGIDFLAHQFGVDSDTESGRRWLAVDARPICRVPSPILDPIFFSFPTQLLDSSIALFSFMSTLRRRLLSER
jgi:hypothetical protein